MAGSRRVKGAGSALAGKSTLNWLELAKPGKTHRYWKVTYEAAALDALLVDVYLIGLAKNERLKRQLAPELARAEAACRASGKPARVFADFSYRTLTSWSRERRVVGKAEHLPGRSNPRFVVTSLPAAVCGARRLHEVLYCARGEMENRIKEQQLALFADRTSSATLRANQLRLYWSTLAYVLLHTRSGA